MSLEKSTPIAPMLAAPTLRPFAVKIPVARQLLGGKSRSQIYVEAGRGRLVLIKDGATTLVTFDSIDAYNAALRPVKIKPYERRKRQAQRT
jgi:hypothetical protein